VPRLPRRPSPPADPARQLSLFGVESVDASPADLAGVLAGPGQLHRMGGTARVSVRVDAAWRVHALMSELAARGLEASWLPVTADPDQDESASYRLEADESDTDESDTNDPDADELVADDPVADELVGPDPGDPDPDDPVADPDADDLVDDPDTDHPAGTVALDTGPVRDAGSDDRSGAVRFEVRTAYSSLLAGLARAWLDGTTKRAPDRFFLTGPRLRLWAAAAGSPHPTGYALGLDPGGAGDGWAAADAALTRAGLQGVVVATEAGPVYRITGGRRLARLAELVGERPPAAPAGMWPGA
jgi:hypothetical protein